MDASVVAKWVLPLEKYQDNALKLKDEQTLGRVELCAPAFLKLEVTNALWIAVKMKRLSEEDAQEAVKTLGDEDIVSFDLLWSDASEVLNIACELDCSVYDAAYLFLSEKLNLTFVTSDTKLYQKAKEQFQVLHLKNYV